MPEFLSDPQRWVIPAVLLVSAIGTAVYLWWEGRHPSSYTRITRVTPMPAALSDGWGELSAGAQRDYDNAVLAAQEAAELAAERAVDESARSNAPHRP